MFLWLNRNLLLCRHYFAWTFITHLFTFAKCAKNNLGYNNSSSILEWQNGSRLYSIYSVVKERPDSPLTFIGNSTLVRPKNRYDQNKFSTVSQKMTKTYFKNVTELADFPWNAKTCLFTQWLVAQLEPLWNIFKWTGISSSSRFVICTSLCGIFSKLQRVYTFHVEVSSRLYLALYMLVGL